MPNKILFHINSLGKGGAERVVVNLADQFVKRNIDVCIATEWKADDEYVTDSAVRRVDVGLTDYEEKQSSSAKRKIRKDRLHKLIDSEKPDVVLSFCRNANYRAILAAKGTGVPVIFSVRSDPKVYHASAKQKLLGTMLYNMADGGVFQTNEAANFFGAGVRKKSVVLLNPLNEKYIGLDIPKERRKVIVTVGRLNEAKDQIVLLKAFNRIAAEYPDYKLLFYGEPSEDDTYKLLYSYVEENKLSDRVLFMGNSDRIEKDIIDASLFVLSSKYEGMPNALIEAMAMGLPVISTDCSCGGPAMLITPGENGYLVPVGDDEAMAEKMRTVLNDMGSAVKMGKKASEIARKTAPDTIAENWLSYIDKVKRG